MVRHCLMLRTIDDPDIRRKAPLGCDFNFLYVFGESDEDFSTILCFNLLTRFKMQILLARKIPWNTNRPLAQSPCRWSSASICGIHPEVGSNSRHVCAVSSGNCAYFLSFRVFSDDEDDICRFYLSTVTSAMTESYGSLAVSATKTALDVIELDGESSSMAQQCAQFESVRTHFVATNPGHFYFVVEHFEHCAATLFECDSDLRTEFCAPQIFELSQQPQHHPKWLWKCISNNEQLIDMKSSENAYLRRTVHEYMFSDHQCFAFDRFLAFIRLGPFGDEPLALDKMLLFDVEGKFYTEHLLHPDPICGYPLGLLSAKLSVSECQKWLYWPSTTDAWCWALELTKNSWTKLHYGLEMRPALHEYSTQLCKVTLYIFGGATHEENNSEGDMQSKNDYLQTIVVQPHSLMELCAQRVHSLIKRRTMELIDCPMAIVKHYRSIYQN